MTPTIQARVAAGVLLLDSEIPGWCEKIDLATLNLASACKCILGQAHGTFAQGLDRLSIQEPTEVRANCGFDIFDNECTGNPIGRAAYDHLTAEWRRVILNRRAEQAGEKAAQRYPSPSETERAPC